MKYTTVIFDLDGTLLNTLNDLAASVNHAMDVMGMPRHTLDEVRRFVGNGVRVLIRRSVPEGTGEEDYERAYKAFEEHYAEHCKDLTAPYEGIPELLVKLRDMGYKTAIVSNKIDFAVKELRDDFFADTVAVAVGDDLKTANKPAPFMVWRALEELGRAVHGQLHVAEHDEGAYVQIVRDLAQGQVAFQPGDIHLISHGGSS